MIITRSGAWREGEGGEVVDGEGDEG